MNPPLPHVIFLVLGLKKQSSVTIIYLFELVNPKVFGEGCEIFHHIRSTFHHPLKVKEVINATNTILKLDRASCRSFRN